MIIVKMNKLIEFTKLTPQQTIELPGCIHISISMFCHWKTFSFSVGLVCTLFSLLRLQYYDAVNTNHISMLISSRYFCQ